VHTHATGIRAAFHHGMVAYLPTFITIWLCFLESNHYPSLAMSNVCEEAQMRLVPRLTSLELQSGQTRQDAADFHAMGVRDPLQQEE
jgi:hypothetical protein